jgi:hypothetical protein
VQQTAASETNEFRWHWGKKNANAAVRLCLEISAGALDFS